MGSAMIGCCGVRHWNYRGLDDLSQEDLTDAIRDLYLKGNRIKTLPPCMGTLQHLRELHLSENLIEALPDDICQLKHLRHLDLAGNCLKSLPLRLASLECLEYLLMNDNHLRELPPGLQNMKKLKVVNANDNDLGWLPQRVGGDFYSVRFTFWRNRRLHHVPFTVWLHVLPDCYIPEGDHLCYIDDCKPYQERIQNTVATSEDHHLIFPSQLRQIENVSFTSPPKLFELCLRRAYAHFDWESQQDLPQCLRDKLSQGPTAICDFVKCKAALFEYAVVAVCTREAQRKCNRFIHITSFFCSQFCYKQWMRLYKMDCVHWKLLWD